MRARRAALATLLLSLSTLPALPAAGTPVWQACPENPRTECRTISVPVDWDRPAARLDIAVARRPATDPAHRIGTLIYLPAGPGSSGVDAVTDDAEFGLLIPPQVAARFDVVSFDPRGVRRSSPVRCPQSDVDALDRPEPRNPKEFAELLRVQAVLGADCRKHTGAVFEHLDSTQTARDVDALRAALGERTVNLYGLSYGTVVGEAYAERFPGRIRTLTLDGVYDHSADSDRFELTGARAAQESFGRFASWCSADAGCVLHGRDVRALVAALFRRAAAGTLRDGTGDLIDAPTLTSLLVAPLTRPDLPGVARQIVELSDESTSDYRTRADALVPLPIYTQCADTRDAATTFAHTRRLAAAQRALAPDVHGTAFGISTLCVRPPFAVRNPQHPLRAPGVPILATNSRYDPATPYPGARRVAAQLGATLLTYDGLGHGAADRTECMRTAFLRYLTARTLPPAGTHCAPDAARAGRVPTVHRSR